MADVFISYASPDRRKARALALALEQCGVSVWWDRRLAAGQDYYTVIETELRAAAVALVLWSGHSAASRWVRDEAALADRLGTLVPVMIEPAEIPLGLGGRQAFDLTGWDGKPGRAAIKALRECIGPRLPRPDPGSASRSLPTSGPGRRRLRPVHLGFVLIGLAVLAAGYWDAFERTHIEFYANVTKRWGLPEGIGRLSPQQVRARNLSLEFSRQGRRGPVVQIRAVNGDRIYPPEFGHLPVFSLTSLNPVEFDAAKEAHTFRVTFEQDASGRIMRQAAFDRNDRPIYKLQYVRPDLAQYQWGSALPKAVLESGITHVRFLRPPSGPDAGLDKTILLLGSDGKPMPDREGSHGRTWQAVDRNGLPTATVLLGADGTPRPRKDGVAAVGNGFASDGSMTSQVYLDTQGHRVGQGRWGVAEFRLAYDSHGNLAEIAWYGSQGQLVTFSPAGAAVQLFKWDDRGRALEQSFLGPDRRPIIAAMGFHKLTVAWQSSTTSVEKYLGPDGRTLPFQGRAAGGQVTRDTRGRITEVVLMDQNGRPVLGPKGCARLTLSYDERGNRAGVACYNEDGQSVRDTNGYSIIKLIYDEDDRLIEKNIFGPDAQPGTYGDTYATVRNRYSPQGKIIENAYFDAAGQPVRTRNGYAKERRVYGLHGEMVQAAYFDENDQPTLFKGLYARRVNVHDERNRLVETAFLDRQGKPAADDSGVFKKRLAWDDHGRLIGTSYLDGNGAAASSKTSGCTGERYRHNERGQLTERACLGAGGSPIASKFGWSKLRITYDAQGRMSSRHCFDAADRPVRSTRGIASTRFEYDELGRQAGRRFFDLDGTLLATRVIIDRVEPGSPGERAGLRAGDALLSYDGQALASDHEYEELELVRGERPRRLLVRRADRAFELEVPAGRLAGVETDVEAAR